jgi:putative component of toxin-antitoxin plasmid stabilization module
MRILQTSKFGKLRKKIREEVERDSLKRAILEVEKNPEAGKKLKARIWRVILGNSGDTIPIPENWVMSPNSGDSIRNPLNSSGK